MTTQEWIDRLDNVIDLQKELGKSTMTMEFTRAELIQLRIFVKVIKENIEEKKK